MDYKYHLAKSQEHKKIICPRCGQKTFVPYVDDYGHILNDAVGRCDRENKCGYHCPPKEYLNERDTYQRPHHYVPTQGPQRVQTKPKTSYMDASLLKQSMCSPDSNNLIRYLVRWFGVNKVAEIVGRYYVGTSNHFGGGAVVYWQVDRCGHIRAGKIMQYNPDDGKRVKKPFNQVTWAHTLLNLDDYNLNQCLFGEHLLNKCQPDDAIMVVESEKTALIFSCILESGICLATGGCSNTNIDMFKPLKGHNVVLFPDNGMFDKWSGLCDNICKFNPTTVISDVMERKCINQGDDIGDLIMDTITKGVVWNDGFDWSDVLL